MLLPFGMFATALAVDADNEVVTVGIFEFDGYHMMDEDGNLYGYGIELLELIERYSHLNFRLVGYGNSWNDMLDMLDSGEIDMVTSARRTPERGEKYDYSLPLGTNNTCLFVQQANKDIVSDDFTTYNGINIGVIKGNSQNVYLAPYAAEKGFTYNVVEFNDTSEMEEALQDGTIDAILSSDLRKSDDERVLVTIYQADFYAIVRKGETKLLDEINYAIEQIDLQEGDWKNVLYYRYYGPQYSTANDFTQRELEYIEQVRAGEKTITATAIPDRMPYSYKDAGRLQGILVEYFAMVMGVADLPYELIVPENPDAYLDIVEDNSVDVIIDAMSSDSKGQLREDGRNGFLTDSYMEAGFALVTRTDSDSRIRSIAVDDLTVAELVEANDQRGVEIIMYPTAEAAMQAVADGEVDAACIYSYAAQLIFNEARDNSLHFSLVHDLSAEFALFVRESADHELITILDKCIQMVPQTEVDTLISQYTTYDVGDMSIFEFLRVNPLIAWLLALVVLAAVTLIIALILRGRWSARLLQAEEESNKAKTTFLNSMSHDIRTPMNAIIGFTSLAEENIDNKSQMRDYLEKIKTSSNHLLSLINDVLDMSRIESGKIEIDSTVVSLSDIVSDLRTIVSTDADAKGINLEMKMVDVSNDVVVCDKLRLTQVLLNVLSNALKYTESDGTVRFTVTQKSKPSNALATAGAGELSDAKKSASPNVVDDRKSVLIGSPLDYRNNKEFANYEFIIEDTGIGMSSAFLKHVFEPFARETTATVSGIQGTGLGLSITKRIVDMMGGTISATSTEGQGSCFKMDFRFEIADDSQLKPMSPKKPHADGAKFDGKHILLVEDNELNLEIAQAMLERVGVKVTTADDGTVAVRMMEESPAGTFDLVLTDVQMPIMDGYEETRNIRAMDDPAKAQIPIVAMTANAFDEDREEALAVGMNGYVYKPVSVKNLVEVLSEFLG